MSVYNIISKSNHFLFVFLAFSYEEAIMSFEFCKSSIKPIDIYEWLVKQEN